MPTMTQWLTLVMSSKKFEWLLERKVISPEDFEWVRSEIEMSQRSFEPDDLN